MTSKEDFDSIDDFSESPKKLPYSTAVLVLGIISIVTCWIYGIIGLICSIIALALAAQDKRHYDEHPVAYKDAWKNTNAGKICAIIGLGLSALVLLLFVWIIFTFVGSRSMF